MDQRFPQILWITKMVQFLQVTTKIMIFYNFGISSQASLLKHLT